MRLLRVAAGGAANETSRLARRPKRGFRSRAVSPAVVALGALSGAPGVCNSLETAPVTHRQPPLRQSPPDYRLGAPVNPLLAGSLLGGAAQSGNGDPTYGGVVDCSGK